MKKIVLLALAAVLLLLPIAASADYVTYFDVINDVKLLLGDDPDALWTMSRASAESAAAALEGFKCRDAGDTTICEKSHWSGEFRITLFFARDKLSAIGCNFTAPAIQDLNYGPGMTKIGIVDDLTNRLRTAGLIPAEAAQTEGSSLFPSEETSAYGPVYEIDENTLLQAGYHSKSTDDPKFGMAFLAQNSGFDTKTGKLADQRDLLIGSWDLKNYYVKNDEGTLISGEYESEMLRIIFDPDETIMMYEAGYSDPELKTGAGTWISGDDGFSISTESGREIDLCTINDDELICSVNDNSSGEESSRFVFRRSIPLTKKAKDKISSVIESLSAAFQKGSDESISENPELTAEPAPEYQDVTDPEKQYDLGKAYYTGEVSDQDIDQALYWLHKSAAQGNAGAQFELGRLYAKEFEDYDASAVWFSSASKLDQPEACLVLENILLLGAKDPEEAAAIVELADATGIEEAALIMDLTKSDKILFIKPETEDIAGVWDMSIYSIEQSDGSMSMMTRDTTGFTDAGIDDMRFVFYDDGSVSVNTHSVNGSWIYDSGHWEISGVMIDVTIGSDDTRYEGGIIDNEGKRILSLELMDGSENLSFDYYSETPDRLTTDENNTNSMAVMDIAPYPVKTGSAEDFFGHWIRAYYTNNWSNLLINTNITYLGGWYTIDDSWMLFTDTTDEGKKGTGSSYVFRDGKLYSDNLIFELNDNGWLSFYDSTDKLRYVWYFIDLDKVKEFKAQSIQDSPEPALVFSGEIDENITLTVDAGIIETGETGKVTAHAPGADAIRIYMKDHSWNGSDFVWDEGEGDSLESYYSNSASTNYEFYAVASYNGVWSDAVSNSETVAIVPAKRLRFNTPDVIHSGETFYLGIYEVQNTTGYTVRIEDASGNPVRELHLEKAANTKMDPLPAGDYKITVSCPGNESHTASADITVSDTLETGYSRDYEEARDVSNDIVLTVDSNVIEAGDYVKINVHAPGADAIRLYNGTNIWKESEGDSLQYNMGTTESNSFIFYAAARYNGVWSDAVSNSEKVTFVPAAKLKFKMYAVNNSADTIEIGIGQVENTTDYSVRIEDASGNPVREDHLKAGYTDMEPLPAGDYKITVTCTGNESHTASADITVSDTYETSNWTTYKETVVREISDRILLTVASDVVETGEYAKVTVQAPGADAVRLFREGYDNAMNESEGDSLEYEFTRVEAGTSLKLYAEASYDGVWSEAVSNTEKVTFAASTILRVRFPEIIHSGETFDLGIYAFENTSEYIVSISDASGDQVREEHLKTGWTDMEPLTAGSYKLTVSAAGDTSHSVTADIEVSDEAETGDVVLYTEEGRVPQEP